MLQARIEKFLSIPRIRWVSGTFREGTVAERAALLLSGAMVILGVWFRCRAVTTTPMWLDEASWTVRLMKDPLKELAIRPIGFMFIERLLARTFSPTEAVVRFLPWLAGITCAVLSLPLAWRLFRAEAARLLFVGIIALDPTAIDYSKEFKPYSISLTIHTALVFLVLRYHALGKARDLTLLLSICLVGVLFAQDALFAFPGVFLLVAIEAVRARRVRHVIATTAFAILTLALIGSLYVFVWSTMNQHKEERAWGKKYDVFYLSKGSQTDWMAGRYTGMAAAPAARSATWHLARVSEGKIDELGAAYRTVFVVLNLAGLTELARRKKWREGLLVVLPLAAMAGFNVLGFWPFGPFRANLFALVYMAAIAGMAFDRVPRRVRVYDFVPVGLLILLPLLVFERKWHASKPAKMSSRFPDVLRTLINLHGPVQPGHKDVLVADAYSCPMYHYYAEYHPLSKTLGVEALQRFILNCRSDRIPNMINNARNALKSPGDRSWLLVSHFEYFEKLNRPLPSDLHLFTSRNVRGLHRILGFEKTPPQPEPGPALESEPEPPPEPAAL
jgi:hypothetical protein